MRHSFDLNSVITVHENILPNNIGPTVSKTFYNEKTSLGITFFFQPYYPNDQLIKTSTK